MMRCSERTLRLRRCLLKPAPWSDPEENSRGTQVKGRSTEHLTGTPQTRHGHLKEAKSERQGHSPEDPTGTWALKCLSHRVGKRTSGETRKSGGRVDFS